jgi:FolB domain-containing protein
MSSGDRILIRDLHLRTIIGLNDWEREKRQDVLLQLEVFTDARAAGTSDDVGDALDYRSLTKDVITHVESSSYFLVEALAHSVARIAIQGHGATRVRVRVEKPGALRFAASVGVEVERGAEDFDVAGSSHGRGTGDDK